MTYPKEVGNWKLSELARLKNNKEAMQAYKLYIQENFRINQQSQEEIVRVFRKLITPLKQIEQPYQKFQKSCNMMMDNLNNSLEPIRLLLQSTQESIQKFTPFLNQYIQNLKQLPSYIQEGLLLLGEHGWYLDFYYKRISKEEKIDRIGL